jgi:hypothetical protein
MYIDNFPAGLRCAVAGVALLGWSGCAGKLYTPPPYAAAPDRFGAIHLAPTKKIYLCPAIDGVAADCRATLDKKFTPYSYLTDALEKEFAAAGVTVQQPPFEIGGSFTGASETIKNHTPHEENAVFFVSELVCITQWKVTFDAKVYSGSGDLLFEKRGLCIVLQVPPPESQLVTHMALRQVLAAPEFAKVLQ